jgi:hypothetical protein
MEEFVRNFVFLLEAELNADEWQILGFGHDDISGYDLSVLWGCVLTNKSKFCCNLQRCTDVYV